MDIALALQWAQRNWRVVLGGLVLAGLLIALMIARGEARHFKKLSDSRGVLIMQVRTAISTANGWPSTKLISEDQMALQISLFGEGLKACTAAVHNQNASIEAMKAAGDKRTAEAEQALEAARKASEGAESRARALEASAAVHRNSEEPACKPSDTLWNSRGDL